MFSFQFLTTLIGIGVAAIIIFLVRRDHLHGPYAVWWLVTALVIFGLGLYPGFFDQLGPWVGIAYPPILAVLLGLLLILIKVLLLDLERSRQEIRLRRLVQRIALMQARLDELEAELETQSIDHTATPQRLNAGSASR